MSNLYVFALIAFSSIRMYYSGFCDSPNSISNAYGFGEHIYISQGIDTLWRYDLTLNSVLNEKQNYEDIFGSDSFERVDTAFILNLSPCLANESYCEMVEKARDVVLVIGKKKQESDTNYGYNAYRMENHNRLEPVPNHYSHKWDLIASGNVTGNFWVNQTNLVYVGSAFDKIRNFMYFVVIKIDEKTNSSSYHLMTRRLNENGFWTPWKDKDISKLNGIFNIDGYIFGIDSNDIIQSLESNNEELDFKPISNAKEFFNCFGNSTLVSTKHTTRFKYVSHNETDSVQTNPDDEYDTNDGEDHTSDFSPEDNPKTSAEDNVKESKSSEESDSLLTILVVIAIIGIIIVCLMISFLVHIRKSKKSNKHIPKASITQDIPKTSISKDIPKASISENIPKAPISSSSNENPENRVDSKESILTNESKTTDEMPNVESVRSSEV